MGEIVETKMVLNELGEKANNCWTAIPNHFPDAILHEFVIMPNHLHGIIELKSANVEIQTNVGVQNFEPLLQTPKINQYQKIIPRSIGSIIRGFKIGVTKWYREKINSISQNDVVRDSYLQTHLPENQIWQRNYHKHIIRNDESYLTISHYIINNPINWKEDKFYI